MVPFPSIPQLLHLSESALHSLDIRFNLRLTLHHPVGTVVPATVTNSVLRVLATVTLQSQRCHWAINHPLFRTPQVIKSFRGPRVETSLWLLL